MALTAKNDPTQTPAMRQYFAFKKQHPECVLFFRMGDFYEMFFDDAKLAHKVLGVTLTQRTEGVPMAGVPYHAVESYLRRMIRAGHRVAVCEQVEDAAQAKASGGGVVKRDVTRVLTPGTLTDDHLLDAGRENPLAAVMFLEAGRGDRGGDVAVAWTELSVGTFNVATFDADALVDELVRIGPRELLFCETADGQTPARVQRLIDATGASPCPRAAWQFRLNEANDTLRKQFGVATLGGFGFADDDPVIGPAGAIVAYLHETQCVGASDVRLAHLRPPLRFERTTHMLIDQASLHSLEIERTMRSGQTEGSLLGVITSGGGCVTAMGRRLLRTWLCYPLRDVAAIEQRQRCVGAMVEDARLLDALRQRLDDVQDVARMVGRIAVGRATPRDLVALGRSAAAATHLAALLSEREATAEHHRRLADAAATLDALASQIASACVDDPPAHLREGGLFRDGHDAQLDEFRGLQRDSHSWLASYQKQLIDETGISSLKVGFNKVFGYYIELTAANRDKAPAAWSRKQTLKNAERFITPELKDFEGKVLSAESRAVAREQELFTRLCDACQAHSTVLQTYADTVAALDVLACFAHRAVRRRYVRPTLVNDHVLQVRGGRHPVLDELMGDRFVPNDVAMGDAAKLALITGPNMAGKSTYIRTAALITLLAHTGAWVPAEEATIGLTDRLFTRIGASDELHSGQSTFMVEMTETANICHHATPGSLVILDEIGRGTSTLDGLSLAWAIAEHLAGRGCRTLFATHYHEITSLADTLAGVTNLHVTVREWKDQIVFLYRIAPGRTDRSYGIHVAKIAGVPSQVIARANQLLAALEVNHRDASKVVSDTALAPVPPGAQMGLFTEYLPHPVVESLRAADLNRLSPIEAFDLLRQLQRDVS
jgi:DNA mismatch repair protein MutS